jgi:hypothetical protein
VDEEHDRKVRGRIGAKRSVNIEIKAIFRALVVLLAAVGLGTFRSFDSAVVGL